MTTTRTRTPTHDNPIHICGTNLGLALGSNDFPLCCPHTLPLLVLVGLLLPFDDTLPALLLAGLLAGLDTFGGLAGTGGSVTTGFGGPRLNVTGACNPTNGLSFSGSSSIGNDLQLGTGLGLVDGGGVGRPFDVELPMGPDLGEEEDDEERDPGSETTGERGRG